MDIDIYNSCETKDSCVNCRHFESFMEAYDNDPLEPDYLGWCHCPGHSLNLEDGTDNCIGINYICPDFQN